MQKKIPAIVFGDHISAYGVIKGLSRHGIPIYIVSKKGNGIATKSRFVKKVVALNPRNADFLAALNKWFDDEIGNEAVLMVAGDDDFLEVLASRRDELRPGMKVTFPDWETVKLVREKRSTYKVAEDLGIPIAKTRYITSEDELDTVLKNEELKFPLFMKAENSSDLMKEYGLKGVVCKNSEEVFDSYRRYGGFGGELLLQELIPGEKEKIVTVLMSLNKNSQPTGLLINEKKRSEGKFLSGTLVATTWSDELLDHSLKIVQKIGYYGYAGTQFILDPSDGQFKLLEINGRISMSNGLALRCGVNLPYLMYQEAIGNSLPVLEDFKQHYANNILWWYLAGDIGAVQRNRLYANPFGVIKSLVGRGYTIEPIYLRDPYPGILSIWRLFRRVIKKVLRV